MKNVDSSKVTYLFDGLKGYILPDDEANAITSFIVTENLYSSAAREIKTKLENLNDEFKHVKDRNPIHYIKSRIKTPKSIIDKLNRLGCELSVESARKNLTDTLMISI